MRRGWPSGPRAPHTASPTFYPCVSASNLLAQAGVSGSKHGATSTEITAAALPQPPHRCRGPTGWLAGSPSSQQWPPARLGGGGALHQGTNIPLPLHPTGGDLSGEQDGLWAAPPALGPWEKVPPSCPLGLLGGRQCPQRPQRSLPLSQRPPPRGHFQPSGHPTALGCSPRGVHVGVVSWPVLAPACPPTVLHPGGAVPSRQGEPQQEEGSVLSIKAPEDW